MGDRSIILRSATPTRDDGRAFARYLDAAAQGFFRLMLGRRWETILATAFVQPAHDLSYQNVTFAERDGAVVGMVSGYGAEQHRHSSLRPLQQAAGRHHLRMRIVRVLFAPLMRIVDSIPEGTYYLQAIAVAEHLRGEGVGRVLMDAFEERARTCGSTCLALDVSARNQTARRFYEGRDMTVESRWPKHVPLSVLRFYRLTKAL